MKKYIPIALKIFILKCKFMFQTFIKYIFYKKNKNYNLKNVKKSFENRIENNDYDIEILTRICNAYNKSKEVQFKRDKVFSPSNEWLPIYENNLADVISALKSNDYKKLHNIFSNFYREDCSEGLVGSYDMKNRFLSNNISLLNKLQWVNGAIHSYENWQTRQTNKISIADLKSPNIGNPYGYYFEDQFISCGLYQHFYSTQIKNLLLKNNKKLILELGAGYGGMAYFLIRDILNVTYLDLDLPENIALTSYYLLKAFPNKKIILYGECDNINDNLNIGNILLMPSFIVKELYSNQFDLVFNSYSLAEMNKETIDYYMLEFDRLITSSGYFYHLNHNSRCIVKADDFGINPNNFNLLYKIKGGWNLYGDEFEYLYKKY